MRGTPAVLTTAAANHSSHPFHVFRLLNELPAFTATLHASTACLGKLGVAGKRDQ